MTGRVSVCFVPYDRINPYQRELANHLAPLGVHVLSRQSLRGLAGRLCRGVEKADIVHLHWLPPVRFDAQHWLKPFLLLLRLRLLRLLGCRIVWTVHNLHHHEVEYPAVERWVARRVIACTSRVIVHSRVAKRLVASEFGLVDGGKLAIVPHGAFIGSYRNAISARDARVQLELPPEALVFLFFGNIRPYKGVLQLVAAYQQAAVPASILVIAGRAHEDTVATLERSIQDGTHVRLRPGFVEDDDVEQYMNACDVAVFPYTDVLTSGAVILAMSFGRACVAPAIGCIPDVLDEHGAFLYDVRDPDGLRKALCTVADSRQRLPEMGAYNLERARQWSWDRIAGQTASIYQSALEWPAAEGAVPEC